MFSTSWNDLTNKSYKTCTYTYLLIYFVTRRGGHFPTLLMSQRWNIREISVQQPSAYYFYLINLRNRRGIKYELFNVSLLWFIKWKSFCFIFCFSFWVYTEYAYFYIFRSRHTTHKPYYILHVSGTHLTKNNCNNSKIYGGCTDLCH